MDNRLSKLQKMTPKERAVLSGEKIAETEVKIYLKGIKMLDSTLEHISKLKEEYPYTKISIEVNSY